MAGKNARLVIWRLRRLTRAISWSAALAIGLLAFEAAFHFSTVAPVLAEQAKLRSEVVLLSQDSARSQAHAIPAADPRSELAEFYAALAQPANAPDLLRRLHRVAREQGLVLDQAEYRPVPDPEGKLTRYQIVLPAKGTYPEVRRFLLQASGDLPGLAVDSISFQRQQIGDSVVDAQIKLTLFLGAPS
jgi:hypothetical protein